MAAELYETVAWGRKSNGEKFEKMTIKRNLPGDDDVTFDLKYCGICHTDVHIANNDMGQFNQKFCSVVTKSTEFKLRTHAYATF